MTKKWYETSFRRNLSDMHIADWDERFLSRFSPETYVENLKRARVQSAMLYLQSHVGLCYYPTRVGTMHKNLTGREDLMRRTAELCRQNGIDVIGYYSLIYNTIEEDKHPEWRIVPSEDGVSARQRGSRYGHCCPNNAEYRAFVKAQIGEIAAYFGPLLDGMFFDMTFWQARCRCGACRARFARETGNADIPAENWNDAAWWQYLDRRIVWLQEFAHGITAAAKQAMPHISVEHNFAYSVAGNWKQGMSDGLAAASDYSGGDLYGDRHNHSFAAKYFYGVTTHQPFEYMTSLSPNLRMHTLRKNYAQLASDVLLTAAHHGAAFTIDAVDPDGTQDARVYDLLGRVNEREAQYEPYFKGKLIADVGIFYDPAMRYHPADLPDCREAGVALLRTLAHAHIPTDVVSPATIDRLKCHKLIWAPMPYRMDGTVAYQSDNRLRGALLDYVRAGGVFCFTGGDAGLLEAFFGASYAGFTKQTEATNVYLAPEKAYEARFGGYNAQFPIAFCAQVPLVNQWQDGVKIAAKLKLPYGKSNDKDRFASIHSDPPGEETVYPMVMIRTVGAGKVIWCAAPIETVTDGGVADVISDFVRTQIAPTLECTAPARVELVTFEDEAGASISAVDLSYGDDPLTLAPFEVQLKTKREPARVLLLPERAELPFAYQAGCVRFETRALELFDMYRVEYRL